MCVRACVRVCACTCLSSDTYRVKKRALDALELEFTWLRAPDIRAGAALGPLHEKYVFSAMERLSSSPWCSQLCCTLVLLTALLCLWPLVSSLFIQKYLGETL